MKQRTIVRNNDPTDLLQCTRECLSTIIELGEDLLAFPKSNLSKTEDAVINLIITTAESQLNKICHSNEELLFDISSLNALMHGLEDFKTIKSELLDIKLMLERMSPKAYLKY